MLVSLTVLSIAFTNHTALEGVSLSACPTDNVSLPSTWVCSLSISHVSVVTSWALAPSRGFDFGAVPLRARGKALSLAASSNFASISGDSHFQVFARWFDAQWGVRIVRSALRSEFVVCKSACYRNQGANPRRDRSEAVTILLHYITFMYMLS